MIIILPKPRVFLGFHLNPKIMESKVGKTPNGIRKKTWNPPFEVGFMVSLQSKGVGLEQTLTNSCIWYVYGL